jgi:hypothetical protein
MIHLKVATVVAMKTLTYRAYDNKHQAIAAW